MTKKIMVEVDIEAFAKFKSACILNGQTIQNAFNELMIYYTTNEIEENEK